MKKRGKGRPRRDGPELERITVRLPPAVLELLRAIAEEPPKESMNELLIKATEAWVLRQKPKTAAAKVLQARVRGT